MGTFLMSPRGDIIKEFQQNQVTSESSETANVGPIWVQIMPDILQYSGPRRRTGLSGSAPFEPPPCSSCVYRRVRPVTASKTS